LNQYCSEAPAKSFFNGIGHKPTDHRGPNSTFVRFGSILLKKSLVATQVVR
jgi:hypothetical protein